MPVLPTDIVVARNVTISAAFSASERKFAQDTISGSVGGGWGPFRAKGSYQSTTTKEDVVGSFDGTTLRIANPQIIGMMGILLPKTPDPDRRLPWGTDADFGDTPTLAAAAKKPATTGVISSSEYERLAAAQTEQLAKFDWNS